MIRLLWAVVLGVSIVSSLAACSAAEKLLSPAEVAGSYQLVSIYGKPLPAESFPGRVSVDSGFLELSSSGDMRLDQFGTMCVVGNCDAFHTQLGGQWSLAGRNRLVMHYATGGTDSTFFAKPGYVISTYLDGARTVEAMRWNRH